ncbi:hypothetical protein KNP414_06239 [Paenibacillus mucilaginosus KNP414]|uniref:Uncharacterized protein n=1 Tax=Paenibacillus mucilaginosus (strain KNP414) TaxID=1036673 RepID=F8FK80_PAEMK|nr:hypothetical protein KNP414_06239 [Paenibacillus mucilaginosus KNP414]
MQAAGGLKTARPFGTFLFCAYSKAHYQRRQEAASPSRARFFLSAPGVLQQDARAACYHL